MLASELISKVSELMNQYGDIPVVTHDLDRWTMNIEKVEYFDGEIYIG
jgi:hypothetical protein